MNNTHERNLRIHRGYSTVDMPGLVFWPSAFILCTQLLLSDTRGTAENVLIDPFEMARTDTSVGQDSKEWLDPFDMTHYSHGEKRMVNDLFSNKEYENCQCERNDMEKNFLKRMVNLLINLSQNDGTVEDTSILLTVTSNQLHELYRLKDAADSEATVRVLNVIFSSMTVPEQSSFIMDIFTSEEVRSNIPAMSFALLPLCIFLTGGTLRRIMIILALAVFAVSFFKTQTLLLKKLEVQNEHTLMKQSACTPPRRSIFNFFGSNEDEECLKQLHAQKIDPALEVTPIQVISHMTAVGLLQPLEHFGIMFSRFSKQIFESHSVLYGVFVFSVGTVIVIYFISVCFAGIFGRNFTFGTRHVTLGMTSRAEPQPLSERRLEAAPENQITIKPNTESSVINHGHAPQPVIQIIHNYPIKHIDQPVENILKTSENKSVDSMEESHKICEIKHDSSCTKHETSKATDSEDNQEQ